MTDPHALDPDPEREQRTLALIERLRADPPRSPDQLAEVTGVTLPRTLPETWDRREPTQGRDGVRFARVEYRTRRIGGALIVIQFDGAEATRAAVDARFGPTDLFAAPRSGHPDEHFAFVRREPWGDLVFGYAQGRPDWLSGVSLFVSD